MSKKDLSKAVTNAADKFFSNTTAEKAKDLNISNNTKSTKVTKHTNILNKTNDLHINNNEKNTNNTNVKNKSKHYDERGKREERYGLLLDKQLKDDLKKLANAYGSRSINDFIITILLEYVESDDNQKILEAYNQLQKLKNT